jgi:hypothetical protein
MQNVSSARLRPMPYSSFQLLKEPVVVLKLGPSNRPDAASVVHEKGVSPNQVQNCPAVSLGCSRD